MKSTRKPIDKAFAKMPYSGFDLSRRKLLTMGMGKLVPVFMEEIIPGDKISVSPEALARMNPLVAPLMHEVEAFIDFHYVPMRRIVDYWEEFITGGRLGTSDLSLPKFTGTQVGLQAKCPKNSLGDYLGLPIIQFEDAEQGEDITPISQIPFRAYLKIYNDYYRKVDYEAEITNPTNGSDIAVTHSDAVQLFTLRTAKWEKDYFTDCHYNTQRGTDVGINFAGNAKVYGKPAYGQAITNASTDGPLSLDTGEMIDYNTARVMSILDVEDNTLQAHFEDVTILSINQFRQYWSLQRFKEKLLAAGGRYKDYLRGLWGVNSSDQSLERAQYVAGGRIKFNIGEVLQTSQTDTTPQGSMAGHGYAAGNFQGFTETFEEHGILMGIMYIMPRTMYCQGMPHIFQKFDRYKFATPEMMNIGEQEVKTSQIFYQMGADADTNNAAVFGYRPIYDEYRISQDTIHGEMIDTYLPWHMSRIFAELPTLNEHFVQAEDVTDRIYPIIDEEKASQIMCLLNFRVNAMRKLPKYGEPY